MRRAVTSCGTVWLTSKDSRPYLLSSPKLMKNGESDIRSIYNKLAKEGAKYSIGMLYTTQAMTTLSPDLLKNTEKFFIVHLNDDREFFFFKQKTAYEVPK